MYKNYLLSLLMTVSLLAVFFIRPNLIKNDSYKPFNLSIDRIFIIVEENKPESSIVGSPKAPFINSLLRSGSYTTNYRSNLDNPYIALTSGVATHYSNKCTPLDRKCQTNANSITSEIDSSGRSWKMYAESMPTACDFKNFSKYVVRHNPFVYYHSILDNPEYCQNHVVPLNKLWSDMADRTVPNYVFISPNICNDMHNCSIAVGDEWLKQTVTKISNSYAFNEGSSLLVITWDEGNKFDNKVLTIFLGSAARQGYISDKPYNHYSLLKTIEYVWNLKSLTTNDKKAQPMYDMLK